MPSILIVDDEEDIREVARLSLEMMGGWEVLCARSGREALELAARERPDVIPGNVLFYHTTAVAPKWSHTFRRVAAIGSHVFYSQN